MRPHRSAGRGSRGRRPGRSAPRASRSRAREHLAQPAGGAGAAADRDERAHDVAHHVVQEGVGLEVEAPVVAQARDLDAAHVLHGRQRLAHRGAEAAEIVLADQQRGGGAHRVAVQRAEDPAAQACLDRRTHRGLPEQEGVATGTCAVARVEVGRDGLRPLHGDVLGEIAVGAAHPRELLANDGGVEVDDLVQRVHAGVGPTGAHRRDDLAARQADESGQRASRACPAPSCRRAGIASRGSPGRDRPRPARPGRGPAARAAGRVSSRPGALPGGIHGRCRWRSAGAHRREVTPMRPASSARATSAGHPPSRRPPRAVRARPRGRRCGGTRRRVRSCVPWAR